MFGKLNIVAVADFRRAPGEMNSSLDEAVARLNDQGSRRGLYAIIRKHQPGKVENGRRPPPKNSVLAQPEMPLRVRPPACSWWQGELHMATCARKFSGLAEDCSWRCISGLTNVNP